MGSCASPQPGTTPRSSLPGDDACPWAGLAHRPLCGSGFPAYRCGKPAARRPCTVPSRLLTDGHPELNALDHLWRHVQGRALAHRPVASI